MQLGSMCDRVIVTFSRAVKHLKMWFLASAQLFNLNDSFL